LHAHQGRFDPQAFQLFFHPVCRVLDVIGTGTHPIDRPAGLFALGDLGFDPLQTEFGALRFRLVERAERARLDKIRDAAGAAAAAGAEVAGGVPAFALARSPSGSADAAGLLAAGLAGSVAAGALAGAALGTGAEAAGADGAALAAGDAEAGVAAGGGGGTRVGADDAGPAGAEAADAGRTGFLPASGAFGSQSLLRAASAASCAGVRTGTLLLKGTGTLVT